MCVLIPDNFTHHLESVSLSDKSFKLTIFHCFRLPKEEELKNILNLVECVLVSCLRAFAKQMY